MKKKVTQQTENKNKAFTDLCAEGAQVSILAVRINLWFRVALLAICILIIVFFSALLYDFVKVILASNDAGTIQSLGELAASLGTYLALVFKVIDVITKHVFSPDDLNTLIKYFTEVMKDKKENKEKGKEEDKAEEVEEREE